MGEDELQVCVLHKHPHLTKECCQLINSEWPRGETLRMRSLEASNDNLPTNLVLVRGKQVIGHCKLSRIPSTKNACFIETVVIAPKHRGLGLGTYLMKKAEEYCKNVLRLDTIYLSTKGQEKFYAKLGYGICEPITIYGCCIPPQNKGENTFVPTPKINIVNDTQMYIGSLPPPPPMPNKPVAISSNVNKIYMKKLLH